MFRVTAERVMSLKKKKEKDKYKGKEKGESLNVEKRKKAKSSRKVPISKSASSYNVGQMVRMPKSDGNLGGYKLSEKGKSKSDYFNVYIFFGLILRIVL